jgi:hypothetical protein
VRASLWSWVSNQRGVWEEWEESVEEAAAAERRVKRSVEEQEWWKRGRRSQSGGKAQHGEERSTLDHRLDC